MNEVRKTVPRRFAKRGARMNSLCKMLGLQPLSGARILGIFEAHEQRREELRKANDPFANCRSVTATAQALGIRRGVLLEWLQGAGWLYRGEKGWCATREAVDTG